MCALKFAMLCVTTCSRRKNQSCWCTHITHIKAIFAYWAQPDLHVSTTVHQFVFSFFFRRLLFLATSVAEIYLRTLWNKIQHMMKIAFVLIFLNILFVCQTMKSKKCLIQFYPIKIKCSDVKLVDCEHTRKGMKTDRDKFVFRQSIFWKHLCGL